MILPKGCANKWADIVRQGRTCYRAANNSMIEKWSEGSFENNQVYYLLRKYNCTVHVQIYIWAKGFYMSLSISYNCWTLLLQHGL